VPLDGGFENLQGLSSNTLAGDGRRRRAKPTRFSHHDNAIPPRLEFDTVFLPGWRKPSAPRRSLDDQAAPGEEERRLAHVGSPARGAAHLLRLNRRMHRPSGSPTCRRASSTNCPKAHVE